MSGREKIGKVQKRETYRKGEKGTLLKALETEMRSEKGAREMGDKESKV